MSNNASAVVVALIGGIAVVVGAIIGALIARNNRRNGKGG